MIRHLLKLVWNRRRTNGLILVELFSASSCSAPR